MAEFTEQVASPWPAEQTFDFMADVRNFQQWDPGVKHAVQVEGTVPALGAAYDVTVGGIGGDMVLRYRIVEFDRPRRVAIEELTPSLRSYDAIDVVAQGDRSVVDYHARISMRGLLRITEPVMGIVLGRIGRRAEDGLRRRLQSV